MLIFLLTRPVKLLLKTKHDVLIFAIRSIRQFLNILSYNFREERLRLKSWANKSETKGNIELKDKKSLYESFWIRLKLRSKPYGKF